MLSPSSVVQRRSCLPWEAASELTPVHEAQPSGKHHPNRWAKCRRTMTRKPSPRNQMRARHADMKAPGRVRCTKHVCAMQRMPSFRSGIFRILARVSLRIGTGHAATRVAASIACASMSIIPTRIHLATDWIPTIPSAHEDTVENGLPICIWQKDCGLPGSRVFSQVWASSCGSGIPLILQQ